jgi:hypothetical protein
MSVRWMVNPIVGLICDWLIPRTIINSEVRARNSAVRFTLVVSTGRRNTLS